jgi:TRAP-type uncharacterized transport system substrate-binding protein
MKKRKKKDIKYHIDWLNDMPGSRVYCGKEGSKERLDLAVVKCMENVATQDYRRFTYNCICAWHWALALEELDQPDLYREAI